MSGKECQPIVLCRRRTVPRQHGVAIRPSRIMVPAYGLPARTCVTLPLEPGASGPCRALSGALSTEI
jgi:hypothetical protein